MTLRGPVLVGTDLSTAADEALRQGAWLATDLASRLLVCHVIPELIPDGSVFTEFRHTNVNVGDSVVNRKSSPRNPSVICRGQPTAAFRNRSVSFNRNGPQTNSKSSAVRSRLPLIKFNAVDPKNRATNKFAGSR